MTASLEAVKQQIDNVARSSGFRCVPVSWEDASRGTVGGALSCWGGNISDVRLWERSGKLLYTVRSDNWNERLGYVAAKDIAVVVGNHARGGSALRNVTLQNYLTNAAQYGGYAGLTTPSLSENQADQILSIRFQTVFLPVTGSASADVPPEQAGRVEFCTDVYNYNTSSDANPRNVLLLCTAQGTAMQQDGAGAKKLFIHEVDPAGKVHRYWLEAERSGHKVGGAQKESAEEAAAAAARGKATATFIGTRAMGTRFNVQMMIQLPVVMPVQRPLPQVVPCPPPSMMMFGASAGGCAYPSCAPSAPPPCMPSVSSSSCAPPGCAPPQRQSAPVAVGVSNAARVSRGAEEDVWPGLAKKDATRDASQHGTITVTMYYTVVGGIPSEADVLAAVADLNELYAGCAKEMRLADAHDVTAELTVKNTQDIALKVTQQPYKPPTSAAPANVAFPE